MQEQVTKRKGMSMASVWLIVLGVLAVLFFGVGALRSFRDMRQARLTHPAPGMEDVSAIRQWMSLHYIAASFHVPEDALVQQLAFPLSHDQHALPLRRLNDDLGLGVVNGNPAILPLVEDAVRAVRSSSSLPPPPPRSQLP